MATTDQFTVSTPTADESSAYYGLWDMLSAEIKTSGKAKRAQALYGVDTMAAVAALVELLKIDRQTSL